MSFYLEAPTGTISLQNLEKFAEKRLDFLIKIYQYRNDRVKLFDVVQDAVNVTDSECLIGGTKKDVISHYFLRLSLCKDIDTAEFFITAESALFEFRFLCMNEEELKGLLKSTAGTIFKYETSGDQSNSSEILNVFQLMIQQTKSWRKVVKLYFKGDSHICFHVPFTFVLNLVAKRQVVLTNGQAAVPFTKLREVMTDIFKDMLREGMKISKTERVQKQTDFRIRKIMVKLVKILRQRHHPFSSARDFLDRPMTVSHDQVAKEADWFPPCMFNLYRLLKERHRLKHHSRIQFTLFLKEIGMPVHEALMFWRKEYSVTVDNQDGCNHTWKDNEKRYIYNIRHLYGLEGSHINYRGHSCESLQNLTPTVGEVGGCPFKHFDKSHLTELLDCMGVSRDVQQLVEPLIAEQNYSKACSCVLDQKRKDLIKGKVNKTQSTEETYPLKVKCEHDNETLMDTDDEQIWEIKCDKLMNMHTKAEVMNIDRSIMNIRDVTGSTKNNEMLCDCLNLNNLDHDFESRNKDISVTGIRTKNVKIEVPDIEDLNTSINNSKALNKCNQLKCCTESSNIHSYVNIPENEQKNSNIHENYENGNESLNIYDDRKCDKSNKTVLYDNQSSCSCIDNNHSCDSTKTGCHSNISSIDLDLDEENNFVTKDQNLDFRDVVKPSDYYFMLKENVE